MLIPSGWIHAVYTPADAIVIGGNFLQGLNIGMQLKIHDVENRTDVPMKFRFPYFMRMQWFAARGYLSKLRKNEQLSSFELQGIQKLLPFLQKLASQLNDIDNVSKENRQAIQRDIPLLKNVSLMLTSLKSRVEYILNPEVGLEDEWDSELTEMEFLDSDVDPNEIIYKEIDDELEDLESEHTDSEDGLFSLKDAIDQQPKKSKEAVKVKQEPLRKNLSIKFNVSAPKSSADVKSVKISPVYKSNSTLAPTKSLIAPTSILSAPTNRPSAPSLKSKKPPSVYDRLKKKLKMK
jgi:hypothetical protein